MEGARRDRRRPNRNARFDTKGSPHPGVLDMHPSRWITERAIDATDECPRPLDFALRSFG